MAVGSGSGRWGRRSVAVAIRGRSGMEAIDAGQSRIRYDRIIRRIRIISDDIFKEGYLIFDTI